MKLIYIINLLGVLSADFRQDIYFFFFLGRGGGGGKEGGRRCPDLRDVVANSLEICTKSIQVNENKFVCDFFFCS